jgi:nucleoside-diphosphate-sugar epimerase
MRFVHISSQAAAGPSWSMTAVLESDKPSPVSVYGESKLASENEVLKYKDKFPVTVIRPPAVYGPQDIDVYKFFRLAKAGINPSIGINPTYVSIIHVHDLVKCIRIAAQSDRAVGETFFACNREWYSMDTLIRIIGKAVNTQPIKIAIPLPIAKCIAFLIELIYGLNNTIPPMSRDKLKELAQKYWICSAEKAEKMLGWSASISIEKGLYSTAEWYKEKRWL